MCSTTEFEHAAVQLGHCVTSAYNIYIANSCAISWVVLATSIVMAPHSVYVNPTAAAHKAEQAQCAVLAGCLYNLCVGITRCQGSCGS